MPRAQLRPPQRQDYYEGLEALDQVPIGPARPIPILPAFDKRPHLLVCHDFQGGYKEDAHAEGYTFEHWAYTDIYVYFSHQRVSLPPDSYVFAAHRHGTRILGTLIFEWEASRPDLRRLLDGPRPERKHIREPLSFYYADKLIHLALSRGIDGYLINIEVPLNVRDVKNVYLQKSDAMHNAARVRQWVEYLRKQGSLKNPNWQVVWYDSVTYPHGQLAWQDAMTPANGPYFRAASAGFTNYTWTGKECDWTQPHAALAASAHVADALRYPRSQVYTGIDMFGRNCFGGREVWKALEMIGTARSEDDARRLGLSVALFAPGWTWEHDVPGNERRTWSDWWKEDCALWLEGPQAIARYFSVHTMPFFGRFRTNFALGAGHTWYVRGTQVSDQTWTDESVSAPKPVLAWPSVAYVCAPNGSHIDAHITTTLSPAAWSGNVALQVALPQDSRTLCIPFLALNINEAHQDTVVRLYVKGAVSVRACLTGAKTRVLDTTVEQGPHGWIRYSAHTALEPGIVHVGLAVMPQEACQLLVGQVDVDATAADEVYEATRVDDMVKWPAFSSDGYEVFSVADETTWLGTSCETCATVAPGSEVIEIRRMGAWIEELVAYA